jgi:hypothetical protein
MSCDASHQGVSRPGEMPRTVIAETDIDVRYSQDKKEISP